MSVEHRRRESHMIIPSENPALAIQRRNRLSESCFEAIVSAADLVYETPRGSQDYAGSDYTIRFPVVPNRVGGVALSVQLKSVGEGGSNIRSTRAGLSYDLDALTHDRLLVKQNVPTALVLVVFPEIDQLVEVSDSEVILMCTPYLIDLEGQPPSGNASSKAVHFNSENRLDPDSLLRFITSKRSAST